MSLQDPKTFKKCSENLQPQVPGLLYLKMLDFPRALKKIKQIFFSYLKFFSAFIVNGSTIVFSKHGKIKRWKC